MIKISNRICWPNFRKKTIKFWKQNEEINLSTNPPIATTQSNENKPTAEYVQIEKQESVTIISLNRPEKRNAINREMAKQLKQAILSFENDETALAAVLYGIGGSFCSGYDIKEILNTKPFEAKSLFQNDQNNETILDTDGNNFGGFRMIKKPIVCGINGYCVANGLELALMCDLRVIEEDACLGFFNRRFGMPLLDGGTKLLPHLIGMSRALDLILTGRLVSGKEAFEMGLANRIVAPGTCLGQSINLANCLTKFPQASLNYDRKAIYSNCFNKSIEQNVSNDVLNEMKQGANIFLEGLGRGGKTQNIKEKYMADWEVFEYQKELEMKHTRKKRESKDNVA